MTADSISRGLAKNRRMGQSPGPPRRAGRPIPAGTGRRLAGRPPTPASLHEILKHFGPVTALDGVNLDVRREALPR